MNAQMILCITHSGDFYTIDIVQRHLEVLGYPSFRLNVDTFAADCKINYKFIAGDLYNYCISEGGFSIDTEQIRAVWYRKLWNFKVPDELSPDFRSIFMQEYKTVLQLFFNRLEQIPWMNNMQIDHAVGGDKMMQLYVANQFGLQVPKTIVSNDPDTIRIFYESCAGGEMVMKLHGALSKSMTGDTLFLPTIKLGAADLTDLKTISYCPMIFQEYVRKSYELRIVYIDGVFFTGKIVYQGEKTDWRIGAGDSHRWESYILPVEIKQKLERMMKHLGLHFGAIDMIRHTSGAYVFLEVNPQGEWGMLQRELKYPIGETIAEKLIESIRKYGK